MKSEAFAHYTDVPLSLFAFIVFLIFFLGIVIWTGLKYNQKKYRKLEQLPLEGSELPQEMRDEK